MRPNQKKILTLIALAVGLGGHVLLQAQLGRGWCLCVERSIRMSSYCELLPMPEA